MAKKTAPAAAPKAASKPAATVPGLPSKNVVLSAVAAAQIAQPHAENIYVNLKGEYHLHQRPGFYKVDMSDGELIVDKIRTDRPIKLANAKPAAPAIEEAEGEDGDEDVAAPTDGDEF